MSYSGYYSINGVSIVTPSGTIASYLGTTEPSGWLICDGKQKTSTTNQFASLAPILNAALSTNTNTASSVTTPNLQSCFLQGRSSTTSGASTTGGASSVTLETNQMPSHTHTTSGEANSVITQTTLHGGNGTAYGFIQNTNTWTGGGAASGGYVGYEETLKVTTTLTSLPSSNAGGSPTDPFSILPPYFTVNYIIKI